MRYNVLHRGIGGIVLAALLMLLSTPAQGSAQTTGDTGQTMSQSGGQVATADDDDDGMDLGWLGLLGLAGLLGLRRREPDHVHRVDPRPTTRP
ncbi:MAG TPA: WGxxGxxG family protein [Gemmatimonadaceae bacterium]|nr:WGxxGxxG family protein [Gemmatimonadaceae bacterium]